MAISNLRRASAACALTLVAVTGCLDSTGIEGHEEPQVGGVRVAAAPGGSATGAVTVTRGTTVGTLTLRANADNALTVQVLGLDAEDEAVIREHPEEFEIRLFLDQALMAASKDGGYPFTLTINPGAQTGSLMYQLQVLAHEHDHGPEFTAYVPVTVVAP